VTKVSEGVSKLQLHNGGRPARAAVLGLPQVPSHNSVSILRKPGRTDFGIDPAVAIGLLVPDPDQVGTGRPLGSIEPHAKVADG
jgi:hypothetical protein